jgi:lipopolysaccharide transport system permease protein
MKVPSDNMEYPVFAFSGLILWTIFSSGITNAGNSMVSNAQIIKKIYFPRLIIPISTILASVIDFAITFGMFLVLIVLFHQPVNLTYAIVFWPMGLLIAVIATFGPGCWLAALNIKYRDFRYVIPFLVQSLLFLTPVIYPISIVSDSWVKYLMAINPMYAAITIFRLPLSQNMPELLLVTISLLSGLVLFVGGLYYFRRTEMYFADLA